MKKRLLSLLLVLTMVLAMVPMALAEGEGHPVIVSSGDAKCGEDVIGNVSDEQYQEEWVLPDAVSCAAEWGWTIPTDWAFTGWKIDGVGADYAKFDTIAWPEDGSPLKIVAQWKIAGPAEENDYILTYSPALGTYPSIDVKVDFTESDTFTLPTAAPGAWDGVITGMKFLGWVDNPVMENPITEVKKDDFTDKKLTVFATWEPEVKPENKTVTYYVGSTEVTMTPTLKDGKFKLPTLSELGLSAPAGKSFKYWRKYEGNGVYNAGEKITFIEGLKFTAVFEEKTSYYVTFYANDGSSASASCTYSELSTKNGYVLPTASELGLDFGWYKNGKYYYGNNWYFDGTYYYTPYFWDNNYTSYKGGYYYYTAKNFEKYCLPYLNGYDCYGYNWFGYYGCSFVCWNTRSDGKGTNYYANKVYSSIPSTLYAVWTYDSYLTLPFTDVSTSSWYYDAIANVYYRGLMDGVSKTRFDPNGLVDRGMLVTVLWRYAGKPYVNYANPFLDVRSNYYYEDAIDWASSKKIVEGFSATEFGPDKFITREQLAAILWRYAGCPKSKTSLIGYADAGSISTYAYTAMQWAVEKGILKGSGSYLMPQDYATRAQVAAMFSRMD